MMQQDKIQKVTAYITRFHQGNQQLLVLKEEFVSI
ncbi:hypothetical protein J2Z66_005382 [Paenibacillus eucommiae]|uniref:Uncharacterized protein n=1 Tax=Paenibacillus eucommiae TaxID=1355755 RepID=A0ABS4J1Q8_9BACL|nr:hypothetical protein [Paenibacillus eucommiae]